MYFPNFEVDPRTKIIFDKIKINFSTELKIQNISTLAYWHSNNTLICDNPEQTNINELDSLYNIIFVIGLCKKVLATEQDEFTLLQFGIKINKLIQKLNQIVIKYDIDISNITDKLIENSKKFEQLLEGNFGDSLIGIITFTNLLKGIKQKITSVSILEKNIELKNYFNLRILFCLHYLAKISKDYYKYINPITNNQLFTFFNQESSLISTYIIGFMATNKFVSEYVSLSPSNQDILRSKTLYNALNILIDMPK
jgi:hypothetical protein